MPSPAPNRSSRVRDSLRQRIADGEWELHSRIPGELALAAEYGVGRGTVREAIRSLTELGIVESAAGRGTFVRSRVPADQVLVSLMKSRSPSECLQLRAAIEGEAARALTLRDDASIIEEIARYAQPDDAHERIPGEFHTRLVEAACEPLSVAIYAATLNSIRDFLLTGVLRHALDDAGKHHAHAEILEAIRSSDPGLAATLAADHARTDMRII